MKICKHEDHRFINNIKDPKYSTDDVLIDVEDVKNVEHVIIEFSNPTPKEKYGKFYMSGKMVRRHRTQPNGRIQVYVVPLNKREQFIPDNKCKHEEK